MNTRVTGYGAHWCPDCRRNKCYLSEHQVSYGTLHKMRETKSGSKKSA